MSVGPCFSSAESQAPGKRTERQGDGSSLKPEAIPARDGHAAQAAVVIPGPFILDWVFSLEIIEP